MLGLSQAGLNASIGNNRDPGSSKAEILCCLCKKSMMNNGQSQDVSSLAASAVSIH